MRQACIDGDGCDDDTANGGNCTPTACGNGVVTGSEECDDGPGNSDTEPDACRMDCTNPRCGDGVVDTGEACDDGNNLDGDYCSADCSVRIPAVSTWGLVVMTLVGLAAGTIRYARRWQKAT